MRKDRLEELPREYFYELEIKHKSINPKGNAGLLLLPLFLNIFSTVLSKSNYEEAPFVLYLSVFSSIVTIFLIVVNLIFCINSLYKIEKYFYGKINLIVDAFFMYCFVPILSAVYLEKGFSLWIVFSPIILFLIGIILAQTMKNSFVKSILKGNLLKGGSGVFSKEFKRKYFPAFLTIASICEAYQLTIIIWSKFLGQFLGMIFFSFIAVIFTCILSILVAGDCLQNICLKLFPDWGSYYK